MASNVVRTTITIDNDLFEKVLEQRARPENARKSISRIINELIAKELDKRTEMKAV